MSDETIKISIVVPIYNVEDYVRSCIESIIGQSYKNLDIILVDDGSTDRCPEICDEYAKKDKRVHVIHKRNGGVTSARKAGTAAAAGEYVLGVDGDDWIEKDRVEVLVRKGIAPAHADMVHLSGYISDFGEESVRRSFDAPIRLFENDEVKNEVFPLLFWGGKPFSTAIMGSLWSWAVRRELLLKNQLLVDDRVVIGEDLLCVCLCVLEAKSVRMIQQGGYHYIQRTSSAMHQAILSSDKRLFHMKVWHRALENRLEQEYAPEKIRKMFDYDMIRSIMIYNYDLLLKKFPDFLFPFPTVNSGARIVVYGAGRIGNSLIQGLNKIKRCSVVLWVDQSPNRPAVPGYTVRSRDAIFSADYDFIVVAIMKTAMAAEVKRSLILDGIPEEKIATMDTGVISGDAIPDEIRDL